MNNRTDTLSSLLLVAALNLTGLLGAPVAAHGSEPSAHAQSRCGSCHRNGSWAEAAGTRIVSVQCAHCHDTLVAARGDFHASAGGRCTSCHSFHDTDILRARGHELKREAGKAAWPAHCAACHREGRDPKRLSEGHRAAGEWYHARASKLERVSPSEACLSCHARGDHLPEEATEGAEPIRFHAEASHPFGVSMRGESRPASAFLLREPQDPRVQLVDGRIECTTCHDLYREANDKLVQFENPYDLCTSCHLREDDSTPSSRPLALSR